MPKWPRKRELRSFDTVADEANRRIRLGGLHSRPVTAPGAPPKRTPWSVVHGHGGVYSVCSLLVERTRVSRPCSLVRKVKISPTLALDT